VGAGPKILRSWLPELLRLTPKAVNCQASLSTLNDLKNLWKNLWKKLVGLRKAKEIEEKWPIAHIHGHFF
jgi:hypothetical protein